MSSPSSNRLVRCRLCGKAVTKNNLRTHLYGKRHEASFPGMSRRPLAELYVELGVELEPAPRARAEEAPESCRAASAPELPPLELDEIVLAVVESLAEPSGLLPVSHLPAVFAWREATSIFLRTVRPGSTERPLGAP